MYILLGGLYILVSDLHMLFENASITYCMERDIRTHAFRAWVDTQIKIIAASSDVIPFSPVPTILFPMLHSLRFVNQAFNIRYLPRPRIYTVQIEAELQFQKNAVA